MPPLSNGTPVPVPVRVAVADDSELVVRGLEVMLAGHPDTVVLVPGAVPGSDDPAADLTLYEPASVPRLGDRSGTPVVPGRSRAVAFSWDCSRASVTTELARGAAGYLDKRLPGPRLVAALARIGAGRVVVDLGGPETDREDPVPAPWPLTPRETVVLGLITSGRSNRDIAEETSLSINSIKSYIRSCYAKIGVASRSQAVLWGVRHGLLVQPGGEAGPGPSGDPARPVPGAVGHPAPRAG